MALCHEIILRGLAVSTDDTTNTPSPAPEWEDDKPESQVTEELQSVVEEPIEPQPVSAMDYSDDEEAPAHEEPELSSELPELDKIAYGIATNIDLVANPLKYDETYREVADGEVGIQIPSIKTNSDSRRRFSEIENKFAEVNHEDAPEKNIETMAIMQRTSRLFHTDDVYAPMVEDDETSFRQGVEHDGRLYGMAAPRVKIPESGAELRGTAAISHVARSIGVGGALSNTLWSSGISINMRPIGGMEYNAIDNRLAMVKRDKAWATSGLTYSAGNSVILVELLKQLKPIIIASNYHTSDPDALYDIIDVTDAQALIGIAAATFFPNGIRFERSCSNVMACDDIASGKIFPDRVRIDDNNKLTAEQRKLGAFSPNGSRKFTYDEVMKYKASHAYLGKSDTLNLVAENGAEVTIKLKVPSLNQFIDDSDMWVQHVIDTTIVSLSKDVEDEERSTFLRRATANTQCSQYLSWIDHIVVAGGIMRERSDIMTTMELIQGSGLLTKGFISGIRKFIRAATVTVIAIPAYTCSKCKVKNEDPKEEQRHPSMIVMDAVELFFQLGTLRKMLSQANIALA